MSTRSKGLYYETQARKLLEANGYLVEKKNYNRFASKDFFNLFDLLAIGKDSRLIQIKSNISDFYTARKKISRWLTDNPQITIKCEIWVKQPRKAWRCEKLSPLNAI